MLGRFLERGFAGLPSLGLRALLCSRVCPASSHTGEWGLRSVCGGTAWLIGPTDFMVFQMAAGEKLGGLSELGGASCRCPGAHTPFQGYLPAWPLQEQAPCSAVPSNRRRDLCGPGSGCLLSTELWTHCTVGWGWPPFKNTIRKRKMGLGTEWVGVFTEDSFTLFSVLSPE